MEAEQVRKIVGGVLGSVVCLVFVAFSLWDLLLVLICIGGSVAASVYINKRLLERLDALIAVPVESTKAIMTALNGAAPVETTKATPVPTAATVPTTISKPSDEAEYRMRPHLDTASWFDVAKSRLGQMPREKAVAGLNRLLAEYSPRELAAASRTNDPFASFPKYPSPQAAVASRDALHSPKLVAPAARATLPPRANNNPPSRTASSATLSTKPQQQREPQKKIGLLTGLFRRKSLRRNPTTGHSST